MSQTKGLHRIQVRNKAAGSGKVMTGASTEVLLDGVPFRGVTFLKFEVKAKGVAKVLVEMFADVEIDAELPLDVREAKQKAVEHELTKYSPSKIRSKP